MRTPALRSSIMTVLACVLATGGALSDTVVFRKDGKEQTQTGKITRDDVWGVELSLGGGGAYKIRRGEAEIVSIRYDAAPGVLYDGIEQAEAGAWQDAKGDIARALGAIGGLDGVQRNLVGQYAFYWLGMCYLKTGEYVNAKKHFDKAVTLIAGEEKINAVYHDSKLGAAEAAELANPDKPDIARRAFGELVAAFKNVAGKYQYTMPYVYIAQIGEMRANVQVALAAEDTSKLSAFDKQIDDLVAKISTKKGDLWERARLEGRKLRALVWEGLERWEELADFLDKEVLEARMTNDKEYLRKLFSQRGNALYRLKKYREAMLDYLYLTLVYDVEGEAGARANYILGECFLETKGPDYLDRAKKHFAQAKNSKRYGSTIWAKRANEALKKVKEIEAAEDAGEKKTES